MSLGCGYPMGPFTLTDYVGLDTTLSILEGWHERFPDDPTFVPPQILKDKVAAGKLGRKSGEGFFKSSLVSGMGSLKTQLRYDDPTADLLFCKDFELE